MPRYQARFRTSLIEQRLRRVQPVRVVTFGKPSPYETCLTRERRSRIAPFASPLDVRHRLMGAAENRPDPKPSPSRRARHGAAMRRTGSRGKAGRGSCAVSPTLGDKPRYCYMGFQCSRLRLLLKFYWARRCPLVVARFRTFVARREAADRFNARIYLIVTKAVPDGTVTQRLKRQC